MKSNGFQPLCASLLCLSPVSPPSWTLGLRQWCYLTSRWWLVIPGETHQQHPNPLKASYQPYTAQTTEPKPNGEMEKEGDTFSMWFLHFVLSYISSLQFSPCIPLSCAAHVAYDLAIAAFLMDLLCRMQMQRK